MNTTLLIFGLIVLGTFGSSNLVYSGEPLTLKTAKDSSKSKTDSPKKSEVVIDESVSGIASLESQISELQNSMREIVGRLDNLEHQQKSQTESSIKAFKDKVGERFKFHEQALLGLEDRIKSVDKKVSQLGVQAQKKTKSKKKKSKKKSISKQKHKKNSKKKTQTKKKKTKSKSKSKSKKK